MKNYKILGYCLCIDGKLLTVKKSGLTEELENYIESIVYQAPKELNGADKYLYMVNNNQHFSCLINTTDLDSAIKHYTEVLKSNMYDELPLTKKILKAYLKCLKFKKENPLAIFSDLPENWK